MKDKKTNTGTIKKIVVLGSKGMLGQMVKRYFHDQGYEVLTFDERFSENSFVEYIERLNQLEDSIIFNCIGRIKQKSENAFNLIWSNSILPLALTRGLKKTHYLIHPSTDCVFNGLGSEFYSKDHIQDALDLYGWSKSLGEAAVIKRENSILIRVSIIGLDIHSNKGLLSWFLNNQPYSKVNGYVNHYWNGITTYEWCKIVHSLISDLNIFNCKYNVFQIASSKSYSKHDMLLLFQEVFETNFTIESVETPISVNRCLVPDIVAGDLKLQLIELKEFWNK